MGSSGRQLLAVAGATGNCGREIVRSAHRRGLRVRALVRDAQRLGDVRPLCDEVLQVELTDPASIAGALAGADLFASALGKTKQTDRIDRRAVDVDANVALFRQAQAASVKKVAFVSVFQASPDHHLALVRMKGEVEQAIKAIGIPHVIIRPTGFFSDMWEFFKMAERGTVWLVGSPATKLNPIALEDLGAFIVDALCDPSRTDCVLEVGGPEALTGQAIADAAAHVLNRRVKVRSVSFGLAKTALFFLRPFSRNRWEIGQFIVGMSETFAQLEDQALAPAYGTHTLERFFAERYQHSRGVTR
ncbi:MAG: SDR family oxidoreductase [Deltaproteobacteria bacterium]|nr:SDR family oxidoreductase [Deltaproteobacteria bacterium]